MSVKASTGAIGQAGDRHWPVEGAPRRREATAAAGERHRGHEAERQVGRARGHEPIAKDVTAPIARDQASAEARAEGCGVAPGPRPPGEIRRAPAAGIRAQSLGAQSGKDPCPSAQVLAWAAIARNPKL